MIIEIPKCCGEPMQPELRYKEKGHTYCIFECWGCLHKETVEWDESVHDECVR